MTPDGELTDEEFRAATRRLDALVREFEALPFPQVRERVFELLQTVDALHRVGLVRLLSFLNEEDGGALVARAAEDPVVRTLLTLYDLLPGEPLTQPDMSVQAVPAPTMSRFIPLTQIGRSPTLGHPPAFTEVAQLEEVPPGTMKEFDVAGVRVLLANVAGEIYAVGAACPGSMAPLSLGTFSPPVVVCPWHNEAFDVRTGKRVDGLAEPVLEVLLIAIEDRVITVATRASLSRGARSGTP